ncbi:MAG: DUF411 domain-containing protein [Gemmatimonadota bacterium]
MRIATITLITVVLGGGAVAASRLFADSSSAPDPAIVAAAGPVMVYKTPTCGCCSAWVDHLREAGFEVEIRDMNDLSGIKADLGVDPRLQSCHTAVIDGYIVEGHVPATDIARMLKEKPDIAGIAVPGMPVGSPGMEGPRKDPYDVLSFDHQGKVEVFQPHR